MNDTLLQLQRIWHERIPISAHMGIEIGGYEDGALRVDAPLEPNVNVHGTGFAGSLYAVAALTGWGRVWLWQQAAGLPGSIVIAEASIRYRAPVVGDLTAVCRPDPQALADAAMQLTQTRRCRLALTVALFNRGPDGAPEPRAAASLLGNYAVHG